jgi:recombination protein RecR
MSEEYNKLFEYFKTFPGIGKRQAERFVFHVLTKDQFWVDNFINEIKKAKEYVKECADCYRVFKNKYGEKFDLCDICRSTVRDRSILAVVERNIDADVMLKKGSWVGMIFVLGGQFQVIEKKNQPQIHLEGLLKFVKKLSPGLSEVILCNSLNPDGVFTASVLNQKIKELCEIEKINNLKITTFGRGFSTGTELEYADKETLQNALKNRSENIF